MGVRPDAEVSDRPRGYPARLWSTATSSARSSLRSRAATSTLRVALVDEDFEFWPQGTAQHVERELPYRGHDGLRRYFDDVAAVWETLEIEPQSIRAVSGGCTAFGVARGRTFDGDEPIDVPVIWVFRLRAGSRAARARFAIGRAGVAAHRRA